MADTASNAAIVTGAGSGIGRAIALQLAAAGWSVALVGRSVGRLDETRSLLPAGRGAVRNAIIIPVDVAAPEAAAMIVDRVVRQWGRLDALINNAATGRLLPLAAYDESLLRETFEVNVYGPVRLIAAAWRAFTAQRRGCVINVSSMAAFDPFPGLGIYAASKSALDSLTRSIRNEGLAYGIRSFSINPGAVETDMLRSIVSEAALPTQMTLDPAAVAGVVIECLLGRRDEDIGRTIQMPSPGPSARVAEP
jgi:NAD(P)-dependent dehydrogenase (short-subunit alcohol dehydrogenase family)